MKIHFGSFLLGVVVGATGVTVARKFRPVAVELATIGFRIADAAATRLSMGREAIEDIVAEARARARGFASGEEELIVVTDEPQERAA